MNKRMVSVYGVMLVSLGIIGCSTSAPLTNVPETPIVWVGGAASLDSADAVIKRALIARGWTGETVKPGLIRGQITVRGKHTAVVDIPFSERAYSIHYVSSTGLDYNATRGVIHRNYNRWVLALGQEINKEFAAAALAK
jgi:hypothetical protein